jgi:hypothetical protein
MSMNDPRRYSHERFNNLLAETVQELQKLASLKGGEYAGDDDRLANFRRNAANLDLRMESVWAVYAAKHWDALMQYVKDLQSGKNRMRLESIAGRCDDLIVYLILFKAMIQENEPTKATEVIIREALEQDPRMNLTIRNVPRGAIDAAMPDAGVERDKLGGRPNDRL